MAIIISNDGNKDVATIAARDALTYKFPGMEVVVMDSIADPLTGGGLAAYKWNANTSQWMLMWKTSADTLTFAFESKVLSNGQVTADYLPKDGIVWEARVIDPNGIIAGDFNPSVSGFVLDIETLDYDTWTLEYHYAYGAIESAVASIPGVSEPTNQIVYGTGTDVTSSPTFTYDPTVGDKQLQIYDHSSNASVSLYGETTNGSVELSVGDNFTPSLGYARLTLSPQVGAPAEIKVNKEAVSLTVSTMTNAVGGSGNITLSTGQASGSGSGGNIIFQPGIKTGSGSDGTVQIKSVSTGATPLALFESGTGSAVGSKYVAVKAPASVTTSRVWTLPQDDPTTVAGQFLSTDGSGVMYFAEASASAQTKFFTGAFVGTLIPVASTSRWYPPVDVTITSVYTTVGVAPTGSSIILDVLKNGTSIFGGTKPTITVGNYKSSAVSISVSVTTSDYLTASITQADSGENLTAFILYTE